MSDIAAEKKQYGIVHKTPLYELIHRVNAGIASEEETLELERRKRELKAKRHHEEEI